MSDLLLPAGVDVSVFGIETQKLLPGIFIYLYPFGDGTTHIGTLPDLTAAQITELNAILSTAQAGANLHSLPNWSTWSAQQASDFVTNNILGGQTQAQIDAAIDATATTLAGVRTILHQIGTAIISIRNILAAMAQAIVFIRDILLRLG